MNEYDREREHRLSREERLELGYRTAKAISLALIVRDALAKLARTRQDREVEYGR